MTSAEEKDIKCTAGRINTLLAVLSATVLTWTATLSCKFYEVIGWSGLYEDWKVAFPMPEPIDFTVGLTFVEDWEEDDPNDGHVCTNWGMHPHLSDEDLDGPMVAARAFGILACTVSILILFVILCTIPGIPCCNCVPLKRNFSESTLLKVLVVIMGLLSLLSLLLLVALASHFCTDARECQFGYAAGCAIGAGLLWWLAAIATTRVHFKELSSLPTQQQQSPSSPEPTSTTVDQTLNPNGTLTTTTTRTVTNADGSQNVYIREYVEPAPVVAEATEVIPAPIVVEIDPGLPLPPPEAPPMMIPEDAKPSS